MRRHQFISNPLFKDVSFKLAMLVDEARKMGGTLGMTRVSDHETRLKLVLPTTIKPIYLKKWLD
jgi:hypothetical protein